MAKSNVNWKLQGKKVKPTTLKVELIESYEYELVKTTAALVQDLEDLITKLDRRSANRGRGFLAVRYNHPLSGAHTEVKETKKGFKITVPSQGKGSPGHIFNLLDQGRPPINTTDLMIFPAYSGSLTKEKGDTTTVNRSRVSVHDDWIATHHVDGITPRKFFEAIANNRKFKTGAVKVTSKSLGKIGAPKVPKFKWQPGTVDIKIIRNGR